MEYSISEHPNHALQIVLTGEFTFKHNDKFKQIMTRIESMMLQSLDIDLSGLEFIDSSGLGMLLLMNDSCKKRDIRVSLHKAQGQVEKILALSRFDELFIITP